MEEIGASVRVGTMRYVREYIGKNHEFAATDGDAHQIEFMFECAIDDDYEPANGPRVDLYQTGVEWLPVRELARYQFYPRALAQLLQEPSEDALAVYLGDVN